MTDQDRIEAVAQALADDYDAFAEWDSERAARRAVTALDAYDAEHYMVRLTAVEFAAYLAEHGSHVRKRIAQDIEAEFIGQDHHEPTYNSGRDAGLRLAARIARGAS